MPRIWRTEFVDLAPDYVGSVRTYHESEMCSGSSKSLQVWRNKDGSITAKCYRCGGTGYYSVCGSRSASLLERTKSNSRGSERSDRLCSDATELARGRLDAVTTTGRGTMGEDQSVRRADKHTIRMSYSDGGRRRIDEWPSWAMSWIMRPGLSEIVLIEAGFRYVDDIGIVCKLGDLYTVRTPEKDRFMFFDCAVRPFALHGTSGALFLVEDYLSYLKLISFGYNAMCLYGTALTPQARNACAAFDKFYIFLDNDTAQVKIKQAAIARTLSAFAKTIVIKHSTDPKYCTLADIEELL